MSHATSLPTTRTVPCRTCAGERVRSDGVYHGQPCGRCSDTDGLDPCAAGHEHAAEFLVPAWIPATPDREGRIVWEHLGRCCAAPSNAAFLDTMEAVVTTDIRLHETLGDDERHYLDARVRQPEFEEAERDA